MSPRGNYNIIQEIMRYIRAIVFLTVRNIKTRGIYVIYILDNICRFFNFIELF